MSSKENEKENIQQVSHSSTASKSYNNSLVAAAGLMCMSPALLNSIIESKDLDYINRIEKENADLRNTVHRLMSDRLRIKDSINELFLKVKA